MKTLPSLRKEIFKGHLAMVTLFGIVGTFFFLASIFIATGITPQVIHANYDSIEAARKMQQAWNALHYPDAYAPMARDAWITQFNEALRFAKGNITEPGEKEISHSIEELRRQWKPDVHSTELVRQMNGQLDALAKINEKGMFQLIKKAHRVRHIVMIGLALFFAVSFFFTLFIVDSLSIKLSKPLKNIAEVLRSKPKPGDKLRLPEPTSLEFRILTEELTLLWERISRTDQLNLEKILKQRNQLETILSSVEDAIITLDGSGRVTHVNQRMSQLVGIDVENIVGNLWNDLPSISGNYLKLRDLFREEAINNALIFDLEMEEGKTRSFEARARVAVSSSGELISTIFLLHDVTEIRQRERLKAEFIGVLSHELKTPLQSLGTAVELLAQKKEIFDARSVCLIETVLSDLTRIRSVTNQFMQADYVPGMAIHMHLERANLSEMLPQWLKPFETLAKERRIGLRYEQESTEAVWAAIDPGKFPWVISNLLTNAIRFSYQDTQIHILLTDYHGYTEIAVTNEGPIIPDDIRRRMFDPYYKGLGEKDAVVSHASGYLGLGLTIVKEVTEAHGGTVEYAPRELNFSCFKVLLPLYRGNSQ